MPKANKDGWIRHRGGKCPVEAGTLVDVRTRYDGEFFGVGAINGWAEDWSHTGDGGDIMAWRPHKAEQSVNMEAMARCAAAFGDSHADVMESVLSRIDGPLQWRDRIHTIDFDKAAAQKAHEAAMAALDSERADLVAKLKAEGLALVQAEDGQKEDMVYWRNWRIGDRIVARKEGFDGVMPGQMFTVDKLDHDDDDQPIRLVWGDGKYSWPLISEGHFACIEWHSRPSN